MYQIKGQVKRIEEIQQISETFSIRKVHLTDASGPYEQTIELQTSGQRVDLLKSTKVGEIVEFFFVIKGKEYKDKNGVPRVINALDIYKVGLCRAAGQ